MRPACAAFSQRAHNRGAAELATILAGPPPGALSMSGGFPNPATFPTDDLDEIVARLLRDEPGVALQYAPSEGIPSVREYLLDRQEHLQGRRPEPAELTVTSGGMECIALVCQALLDPGDTVAVEAPTYLGALMAFAGARRGHRDPDGRRRPRGRRARGAARGGRRPKLLYVIPEYQNPSGRTLALERREPLIELCRRHGVLIVEDVAYREMAFDSGTLPSLWSLGPDIVLQAGTFSKIFCPGVRLGWAVGPADVVAQLAAAKQPTTSARAGSGSGWSRSTAAPATSAAGSRRPASSTRAHWRAVEGALHEHMPPGVALEPADRRLLHLADAARGLDSIELRPAAVEAGVTYVPGRPFYPGDDGRRAPPVVQPPLRGGARRRGRAAGGRDRRVNARFAATPMSALSVKTPSTPSLKNCSYLGVHVAVRVLVGPTSGARAAGTSSRSGTCTGGPSRRAACASPTNTWRQRPAVGSRGTM